MWWITPALGAPPTAITLEGTIPVGPPDHFRVPFEVPEGIAEIEIRHDDGSEVNILDWGLEDPAGWRGWGGGNVEPIVVGIEAASRSYVPGPIPSGTWNVVVGEARVDDPSAGWAIEIVLRDAPTLPPQPERRPYAHAPPLEVGARWYAGDLHVHSRESGDASPTLDEIADTAAARGLDFVVVTDHDTVTQLDWFADAQARHPDVLLVPGTEYTTYQGHANALGATAWVDHKLGTDGVTIESAAAAYAAQGAVFSLNHPALDLGDLCIGCAWDLPVPLSVGAIEVGTGGWEPIGNLFTPLAVDLWEALSAEGRHLAAVGGSDDHQAGADTGPFASPIGSPTTMVWADELSVPALLDAIRAERTVVKLQDPTDPMVALTTDGDRVTARVTGGVGAELVWVVDGEARPAVPVDADPFTDELGAPTARVRVELWGDGHPRVLTSHAWTGAPPAAAADDPGCGCRGSPLVSRWLTGWGVLWVGARRARSGTARAAGTPPRPPPTARAPRRR
ncbi:MAG: CehA/McbA family metallohydrolase [Myxococcota bacterium]